MQQHLSDPYVKQSQIDGYRSRAVYKLKEINEQDHIIKPGITVVDLGAAPGGWSQYVAKLIGNHGILIAVDILDMEPIPNADVIKGDFTEESVLNQIISSLNGKKIALVISDMAPNITGVKATDQAGSIYLAELALDLAHNVLDIGGNILIKVFQGEGFDDLVKQLRKSFTRVLIRKPKASRPKSSEVYLLAMGYREVEGSELLTH